MATILKTKNSVTAASAPSSLAQGELAVNITDKKMWVGNASSTPVQILGSGVTNDAGGSNTQVQYNSSGLLAGSANMTFDGTTLTANALYSTNVTTANGGLIANQGFYITSSNAPTGASGPALFGGYSSGGTTAFIQGYNSTTSAWIPMNVAGSVITFGTGSSATERMRITSTGIVGIGTSTPATLSPYANLGVLNGIVTSVDTAQGGAIIGATTTGTEIAYISFGRAYNLANSGDTVISTSAAKPLIFGTNNAERVRIDSSGNVGIGSIPSAWSVVGPVTQYTGGGFVGGQGTSNTFYVGQNHYYNGTNFIYTTTGYATQYQSGGGTGSHIFFSAPSGTAGSVATMTQVLKFGKGVTVALEGANTQVGTGITFPAAQVASSDANTLDDYEEGTWTPTIYGGSTTGTTTYGSNRVGRYTKIGNVVTIQFTVGWTGQTGTGSLNIGGLPFTTTNAQFYDNVGSVMADNVDMPNGGTSVNTYAPSNATYMNLYVTIDNAGLSIVNIDPSGNIYGALTYFTAT